MAFVQPHSLPATIRNTLILGCLILGSWLRLIWADDMEWKREEQWMFEEAQPIGQQSLPLPAGCIMSSIGIPNPGLGLWVFVWISKFAHDPVAMVRWVQGMNVVVLWLFWGFVLWQIATPHRRLWMWGLGITSVNPFAVLFARKIWIPDLLAPFCFIAFVGHWFRDKFWGAFLWGAFNLLSAQIHMGGFFFTLGMLGWTIWSDAQQHRLKQVSWCGYGLGLASASIPLVFWLLEALPQWQGSHTSILGWLVPKFYLQWITSALGINLSYSLKGLFWSQFLQEPLLLGQPTFLMLLAHIGLVGVGLMGLYRWLKSKPINVKRLLRTQEDMPLDTYLKATGLGVGVAFSASAMNVVPYYIPIVFPFQYLWLATLYAQREKILVGIVLAQFLISLTFLGFIHRTGGFDYPLTDYGRTYRVQLQSSP